MSGRQARQTDGGQVAVSGVGIPKNSTVYRFTRTIYEIEAES